MLHKPQNPCDEYTSDKGMCAVSSLRLTGCTQKHSYERVFTCPKCLCVLQTKSEAAEELERFRKASEEGEGPGTRSGPSTPSVTCTSPPGSTPPPLLPQPAMNAPPPPPPVLVLEKPSSNATMNPALAREAMLEAIRSGAAADKLKKVKCAPVWSDDHHF